MMGTRPFTDHRGEWIETFDDKTGAVISRQQVTESPAFTTEREALRTAAAALATKRTNNLARIELLAKRAARYARDPVANAADQLPTRLIHELLARLALAEATDDQ